MARIILVDDSASARALLGLRLRKAGHTVVDVANAVEAAEIALSDPPHAIVTDLWMPGISGLQLCRLLRAEPATQNVPVVLLTASDDRRSRFWARHAGATAYVMKSEIDRLLEVIHDETKHAPILSMPPQARPITRGTVPERLSQLLDTALYDTTVAGEVRALGQNAGDLDKLFSELVDLTADVLGYRWFAFVPNPPVRAYVHTHPDLREAAEREVRDAFGLVPPPERRRKEESIFDFITDTRAVAADWAAAPLLAPVKFGGEETGRIALGPSRRGASNEDRRVFSLLTEELGGPLRMAALMAEARRLASTDTLTGLMNRRAFFEKIDLVRKAKPESPMSLLLMDLDHFKQVNDKKGHDAGDAVLQSVAQVLTGIARKTDVVARWGGEEFVVGLMHTAETGARIAAERVRRAIAETPAKLPSGEMLPVTASIGLSSVASMDGLAWDLDDMLTRADKAMYAAKGRGRNRVETA